MSAPPPPPPEDSVSDAPPAAQPPPPPVALADGVRHRLDPAWVTVERIAASIRTAALGGAAGAGLLAAAALEWLPRPLLLAGAAAWLLLVPAGWILGRRWPAWEYKWAGYRLTADDLEIWSGVLWRRAIRVPLSRLQYTDVQQGPLQRCHGIATLEIHTAGTESARVDLPGLARDRALRIRDALIEHGGDDAV